MAPWQPVSELTVPQLAAAIRAEFPGSGYSAYHSPRWAWNLKEIDRALSAREGRRRILDIGRTVFTSLIVRSFDAEVDSLGFEEAGPMEGGVHHHFDLNDAQFPERWITGLDPYDVIVFSEVIEHLYTAPQHVLSMLRTLLRDDGEMILQTPNAVQLANRVKMVLGRNPFHLIHEDRTEPSHFREYTCAELEMLMAKAGLALQRAEFQALSDWRYRARAAGGHPRDPDEVGGRARNLVYRSLPPGLRPGLSLIVVPA